MISTLIEHYLTKPHHRGKNKILDALYAIADGSPIRSVYGPRFRLHASDYTSRSCIGYSGSEAADYVDVYEVVSQLEPGMAFIDIGANAGLFSLVASKRVGSSGAVLAFEPSMEIFGRLVDNILLNGAKNIFPFNAAIGNTTGLTGFATGEGNHSGVAHLDPTGGSQVLQMSLSDLEFLFSAVCGERKALVKVDVEGAEALVVSSMVKSKEINYIKKVIVEIDHKNLMKFGATIKDVYGPLEEIGFKAKRESFELAHYNEILERE